MFFSNILHLARASGFRGGLVLCLGARVSRAATSRTCTPTPGWRHPCRVPYPGLPIPADLRPASHNSAAGGGGTSKVNQRAAAKLPLCQ